VLSQAGNSVLLSGGGGSVDIAATTTVSATAVKTTHQTATGTNTVFGGNFVNVKSTAGLTVGLDGQNTIAVGNGVISGADGSLNLAGTLAVKSITDNASSVGTAGQVLSAGAGGSLEWVASGGGGGSGTVTSVAVGANGLVLTGTPTVAPIISLPTATASVGQYLGTNAAGTFVVKGATVNLGTGSVSSGSGSIAIGASASALANGGVAIGGSANMLIGATNGVAIGANARVGQNSTAVGYGNFATGLNSTAVGGNSDALGQGCISLGTGNVVTNDFSIGIGRGVSTLNDGAIVLNGTGVAMSSTASSLHVKPVVAKTTETDVLYYNATSGLVSYGAGGGGGGLPATTVAGEYLVSDGSAYVTAGVDVKIGNNAFARGNGVALGVDSKSGDPDGFGSENIAIGNGAYARNVDCIAIGHLALAQNGNKSICIGKSSECSTNNAICIGELANVSSANGIAIGTSAICNPAGCVSIGSGANIDLNGAYSVALGVGATISNAFSVALGAGAKSTHLGAISLGRGVESTASSLHVKPVIAKTTETDVLYYDATSGLVSYGAGGGGGGGVASVAVGDNGLVLSGTATDPILSLPTATAIVGQYLVSDATGKFVVKGDTVNIGTGSSAGSDAVAIGMNASAVNVGTAIGANASAGNAYSVAIGQQANASFLRSIVLSADGSLVSAQSSLYVKPVVAKTTETDVLYYDATSGLVSYGAGGGGGGLPATTTAGEYLVSDGSAYVTAGTTQVNLGGGSVASGANSVAIGVSASSAGLNSIAIGNSVVSAGEGCVSYGYGAQTNLLHDIAIGSGAVCPPNIGPPLPVPQAGINRIAIGNGAVAYGENCISIGHTISNTVPNAIVIGNTVNSVFLESLYVKPIAANQDSTNILYYNESNGLVTYGAGGGGSGVASVAVGANGLVQTGTATDPILSLPTASATAGQYLVTDSTGKFVVEGDAIRLGSSSEVSGIYPVAVGFGSFASGGSSIAVGRLATASEDSNIAIGVSSLATGAGSTSKIAIGNQATARGQSSVALGQGAKSSAPYTIACGYNAEATFDGAIVLNGSASTLVGASASLYVKPIIDNTTLDVPSTDALFYNPTSGLVSSAPVLLSVLAGSNINVDTTIPSAPVVAVSISSELDMKGNAITDSNGILSLNGQTGNSVIISDQVEIIGSSVSMNADVGALQIIAQYSLPPENGTIINMGGDPEAIRIQSGVNGEVYLRAGYEGVPLNNPNSIRVNKSAVVVKGYSGNTTPAPPKLEFLDADAVGSAVPYISATGGSMTLSVGESSDLILLGAGIESATSGGNSGQHLRIKLNGTFYKIALQND
jgi:hypothetical protein